MTETLTVNELARLCEEETGRYRRGEPYAERFCLELFRRAIVRRDHDAWSAVYRQYAGAVGRWLGSREGTGDEGVTDAFERFWKAVDGAKFARFGSLAAILQYLKMCAHTVRLDRVRAAQAAAREQALEDSIHVLPAQEDVQESTLAQLEAGDFWHMVQEIVAEDRERLVIYLSYVIGLTPRDICVRYQTQFPDVGDVYRLKRNALDRLRRSPKMKSFLPTES